jgi:hypothetical protein
MTNHIHIDCELTFPALARGTMVALEVDMQGAEVGDEVSLSSPPFLTA